MIKVGDKIIVKGDVRDFTDHLDGEILTVVATPTDCGDCILDDDTYLAKDKYCDDWYICAENITEVVS